MTSVRRVRGGKFLPGSKESREGVGGDATDVGVGTVKMPQPGPAEVGPLMGIGGLGGCCKGAVGLTAAGNGEGLGNLLRRLALASGRTMRKEALPL